MSPALTLTLASLGGVVIVALIARYGGDALHAAAWAVVTLAEAMR